MSEKKREDPFVERIARLEVIVDQHETRLEKLESSLAEIKQKLDEVLATQRGLNFFLKNVLLPIAIAVITALILTRI